MSSIVVAGDTSGSITIAAPLVAGSNTITLPAATGTVVLANASGNVGIGTASPASKLDVHSSGQVDKAGVSGKWTSRLRDTTNTAATGSGGSLLFTGSKSIAGAAGNFAGIAGLKENSTDSNEQGYLAMYTTPVTGVITERMRIDSSGNVGIGTASPGAKLHVNGNGAFSGAVGCTTRSDITSAGVAQGTPIVIKIVKPIPAVSLGTKLRIPFISQPHLNHQVVLKVWGTTANYNVTGPTGFECSASISNPAGTPPTLQASWGTGGNYASMAIVGQYLEISFTSAYTSPTNNGIVMILEYVTPGEALSINVAGIVMN